MFDVPYGTVHKDDPCPLNVNVLFCISTFYCNLEHVTFTTVENCRTNENVMHFDSNYIIFIRKKK